ncbi:MAG: aldose 1-epimerase family protein [Acetobacteraceae bacterium]|nr:aldose 1-epimerase family protein [Acetobacteraceae bacterium]
MDRHSLSNGYLSAAVKADGAELCSLRDTAGTEMLWQAHPIWPRHAPVLFPIVGRLKGDVLRHKGREYHLPQHGFARDRRFAWFSRTATSCRLVLHDDGGTRAHFPFAFRLEVGFTLDDDALTQTFTVANTGREVLPASIGAHPAFVWPLAEGVSKEAHVLEFAAPEAEPVRRLTDGLLKRTSEPTPFRGNTLSLEPALFEADAIVLDRLSSRSVRYSAPGAEAIELSWEGFRELGIWSRSGGDFLCIEPWRGTASPVDFDGEFYQKPGLMLILPGEQRILTMRVRLC